MLNAKLKQMIIKRDLAGIAAHREEIEADFKKQGMIYSPVFGWMTGNEKKYLEEQLEINGYLPLDQIVGTPCFTSADGKTVVEPFIETFEIRRNARRMKDRRLLEVVEVFGE